MKIISKFQDYYDSVQAYGQDANVVYIRHRELLSEGVDDILDTLYRVKRRSYDNMPYAYFNDYYYRDTYRDVEIVKSFSVFFCGQRFNAIKTTYSRDGAVEKKLHYDQESLDCYIDSLELEEKKRPNIQKRFKRANRQSDNSTREFFALNQTIPDVHFRINSPIFIITRMRLVDNPNKSAIGIIKNPKLTDFDFQRVKDPFTLYQELDMYISGVMGGRSPVMARVSDADMKAKKGFYEYSFKTRPKKGVK